MSPLINASVVILNLFCAGAAISPCAGQEGNRRSEVTGSDVVEQFVAFDIPSQPLASALGAYGVATHVQLFVDAQLLAGRRSTAVYGRLAVAEALKMLLAGTGLEATGVGDRGFTLAALSMSGHPAAKPVAASTGALRFNAYSAMIQDSMRDVLCRYDRTRNGSYRIVTRLWIGGSGLVTRAELISSTGDIARDTLLSGSFHELAIGVPPPVGLPQPVTLLIDRDEAQTGYCERAGSGLRRVGLSGRSVQ